MPFSRFICGHSQRESQPQLRMLCTLSVHVPPPAHSLDFGDPAVLPPVFCSPHVAERGSTALVTCLVVIALLSRSGMRTCLLTAPSAASRLPLRIILSGDSQTNTQEASSDIYGFTRHTVTVHMVAYTESTYVEYDTIDHHFSVCDGCVMDVCLSPRSIA